MTDLLPARVNHPGRLLARELAARHMDIIDLWYWIPLGQLRELVDGTGRITPELAVVFGRELGTSPELWLNAQRDYDAWRERIGQGQEGAE